MIPSWETLVLRPCGWGVQLKCAFSHLYNSYVGQKCAPLRTLHCAGVHWVVVNITIAYSFCDSLGHKVTLFVKGGKILTVLLTLSPS